MKILIGTDGSVFSRAAIEKCCEMLIEPERAEIKIISVYQNHTPLDTFPQTANYCQEIENALHGQAEENAANAVAAIREHFPNTAIDFTTQISQGFAERIIVETAKRWNADLVVVGSHGRGFWGRKLIGSVSDAIVHHAPCPVLIARQKPIEKSGGESSAARNETKF